jgi:hypothetical protein
VLIARKLQYGVYGVLAVTISTGASVMWGDLYPVLVPINAIVCWVVGKLLGVPIDSVITAALAAMTPDKAIGLAVTAVSSSMPPAKNEVRQELTREVIEQFASHAVASMPPAEATSLARGLIASVPASDRARLAERIVFLQSQRPAPLPVSDVSTSASASGGPVVTTVSATIALDPEALDDAITGSRGTS